jgi:hypothetical protein
MTDGFSPGGLALGLTIVIALFTVPSIRTLAKANWRVKNPNHDDALYEDEDGAATEESMAQFSNKTQFTIIFIVTLVGLAISFTDAIFTAVKEEFDFAQARVPLLGIWLLIPAWVSRNAKDKGRKQTDTG